MCICVCMAMCECGNVHLLMGNHVHVLLCVCFVHMGTCVSKTFSDFSGTTLGLFFQKPFRVCGDKGDLLYSSADQLKPLLPRQKVDGVVFTPFLPGVATEE